MIISYFFVELGPGEASPNPGLHVATIVVAFAKLGVVIDFNPAFPFVFLPGQFDNLRPAFFGLRGAVFTESAIG